MDKNFFIGHLKSKLKYEFDNRIEEISENGIDEVVSNAKEIAALKEIEAFDYSDLDAEQLQYLISLSNPLMIIYNLWNDTEFKLEDVVEHITVEWKGADEEAKELKTLDAQSFTDLYNKLVDKLYTELMEFEKKTPESKRDENFLKVYEIKKQFRDAVSRFVFTDDTLTALSKSDYILQRMYGFSKDFDELSSDPGLIDKITHKFIMREMLAQLLYEGVKDEYNEYIEEVKKLPPEKIIDEAYKLTFMHKFYNSLDPYTSDLSTERVIALLSVENPLNCLYNGWLDRDISYTDDVEAVITETADTEIVENGIDEQKYGIYKDEEQNFEEKTEEAEEMGFEP